MTMPEFVHDRHSEQPPYLCVRIPPEAGEGPDELKNRIRDCAELGVDAVSVPLYRTDHLVSLVHRSGEASDYRDRQLPRKLVEELGETTRDSGLDFTATVYDPELLEWFDSRIEAPFYCLHGGDVTYRRLLETAGQTSKATCLSTAAAGEDEIQQALDWVGTPSTLLLHEPLEETAPIPNRVRWLRETFNRPVGFLDRFGALTETPGILPDSCDLLVVLLDGDSSTTGYSRAELQSLIETLRNTSPSESGPGGESIETDPLDFDEVLEDYRSEYRRSLMASQSLSAGQTLTEEMVRELRPAGGLPANRIRECLGMMVTRPTDPQEMIAY